MKNPALSWVTLAALTITLGCQPEQSLPSGEGFAPVQGGKVWYRVVGSGDKTPLLLLHGGPGAPSYYLNPMAALAEDRPVIFWDQLGCGRSGSIIDTSMMTVESHVEQLEQFRIALGIEQFYLYGHSWGTMLGLDYYLKYPEAVKAIIFASPALSVDRWTQDADILVATMPDSIQTIIQIHTENETFDSPDYQQAVNMYYQKYLARKLPWSSDMDSTFSQINEATYNYMWGPSEFTSTGNLKNYERTDRLPEIAVPTLFVTGEFDEALPSTVQYFQSLVPGAQFKVIKDAGHTTMHDNPKENNLVISEFLTNLEQ